MKHHLQLETAALELTAHVHPKDEQGEQLVTMKVITADNEFKFWMMCDDIPNIIEWLQEIQDVE